MNNFPSFLENGSNNIGNNVPRQAPSPNAAQHQANGLGAGAGNFTGGIPQAGHQMDINIMWGWIQQLSEALQEERQQSSTLVAASQRLARRAEEDGVSPTIQLANGEMQASRLSELANLQSQLSTANRQIAALETENTIVNALADDYQSAMDLTIQKLRPFAHQHQTAINALHVHYKKLLEDERQANLELRLEQNQWQAGLGRVADWARKALREHAGSTEKLEGRIKGLKSENKILRRLAGWEEVDESSDEEDEVQQMQQHGHIGLQQSGDVGMQQH